MVVPSLIYKTGGAAVIPGISEAGKNKTIEINPRGYACMLCTLFFYPVLYFFKYLFQHRPLLCNCLCVI